MVTVGTFDGVHLGHQQILKALNAAAQDECVRTVITFEPHPQSVILRDGYGVPILTPLAEKMRLLCRYGVDRTYVLQFDPQLQQLSAENFVQEILLRELHTQRLIIGYNHSFGRNREGNFEFLEKNKMRYGLQLEVVGPHYVDGEIISSTKVRRALSAGEVDQAALFLGRPFQLSGKVIKGAGRGRQLGYPTANLEPLDTDKLIPKMGVYAVAVERSGQLYPGMLSIGTRPTFGENTPTIEVNLIGFEGDLYDHTLTVHFLTRLRDEARFATPAELKSRMDLDRENSLKAYDAYPHLPQLRHLAELKSSHKPQD